MVEFNNEYKLKGITKKMDLNLKNLVFSDSVYSNDFYISTDQRIIIPSKSNLMGLSPFCLKLDHDFIKKDKLNQQSIDKFKKKIYRSLNSNMNDKEFINEIERLYDNEELLNSPISEESKVSIQSLFSKYTVDDLKNIILSYYQFIKNHENQIIEKIIQYKDSDFYDKKDKSNFYLVCTFNNDLDLLNDVFYYYSKFVKTKNKFAGNPSEEVCVSCGEKSITVPSTGSFVSDKYYYFNNNTKINNAHLKLCKNCNSFMSLAEDKLKKSLMSNVYLIPKSRDGSNVNLEEFIKVLNKENVDFIKLNEILQEENIINYFDIDLAIYTQEKGDTFPIRRYVENYKSFLVKFDDIELIDNKEAKGKINLKYLFDESIVFNEKHGDNFSVETIFDIERIFISFFKYVDYDGKYHNLFIKYLYQIYSRDFVGKTGITKDIDAKTTSIFSKYMYSLFSFIYELNFDALTKQAMNEIVFNCIEHYVKVNKGESYNKYNNIIRERLNEYYMLMNEFWRIDVLDNETLKEIKILFKNYQKEDDYEEFKEKVLPLIESNSYIKYYLIGQFIKYIDNFKRANGFNPEIFSNFMTNVNRNNAKKMFSTEVLQKNIFYINQMSKKSKLLFEVLESNMDSLFNEADMNYEDYLLTLCTGYYTENILSNNKEE